MYQLEFRVRRMGIEEYGAEGVEHTGQDRSHGTKICETFSSS